MIAKRIRENLDVQRRCRQSGLDYILIDQAYDIDAIADMICSQYDRTELF